MDRTHELADQVSNAARNLCDTIREFERGAATVDTLEAVMSGVKSYMVDLAREIDRCE